MYDQRSPNEIHLQHQWKWEKNLQNIIYECNLRNSKQRMNWLIKKLTKNFKRKDFDEKENEAVQKTTQVWVLNTKLKKALPQECLRKAIVKKLKRWTNMSPCGKPEDWTSKAQGGALKTEEQAMMMSTLRKDLNKS